MTIDIRKVGNIKKRVMIRNIEVMSDKCNVQTTYASVIRTSKHEKEQQ